jgi:hypothetical protein
MNDQISSTKSQTNPNAEKTKGSQNTPAFATFDDLVIGVCLRFVI